MKDKVKFVVSDNVEETPVDTTEIENTEEPVLSPEEENTDVDEVLSNEVEEKFYATGVYEELRDAMQDTDFRLFLINDDLVIPGTLEGNEIQFLDYVGAEGEEEFVMKPAPSSLKEVLEFGTLYNTENTEIEVPEGIELHEAPHEKIIEYILNLKVSDKDADDVEDDEQEIKTKENEEEEEKDESNEE